LLFPRTETEEEDDGAVAASLKSENEALRQANEKLAAEIAKLGGELATYELRLGKGDYNPATTKVPPRVCVCACVCDGTRA
jgi:hypothetical protein